MRVPPWMAAAVIASLIGCDGSSFSIVLAPGVGFFSFEFVSGSGRQERDRNGNDHIYRTFTVRNRRGLAMPGAGVRVQVIHDTSAGPITQQAADAEGRWTLDLLLTSHEGGTIRAFGCAANPGEDCEPSVEIAKVVVRSEPN